MRALLDVLSPHAVRGLGALAGAAGGVVAVKLADVLPGRYDVTLLVTGRPRAKRNALCMAVCVVLGVALAHLFTEVPNTPLYRALFYYAVNFTLLVAIVAAAIVDLEHMTLPNELTLGGAALALLTAHWRGLGIVASLVGVAAGLALTYVPALIYKIVRGRSGQGLGDAKLAMLAGAWLGASGAIFVVFAGAIQAALCGVVMRVLGVSFAVPASVQAEIDGLRAKAAAGDQEALAILADDPMAADAGDGALTTMRLPMGPFLVLSCIEMVFARAQIMDLFDRYVAPP